MNKLRRTNGPISGVCGGIAETYNIDPTIVRVIFGCAVLFSGIGLVAYIILWIVTPKY